jgi:hypothetical protein
MFTILAMGAYAANKALTYSGENFVNKDQSM